MGKPTKIYKFSCMKMSPCVVLLSRDTTNLFVKGENMKKLAMLDITSRILFIRHTRVMLDHDLAKL